MRTVFVGLAVLAILALTLTAQHTPVAAARLDHVPIAVRDLDAAATSYTTLGFTLTPGRIHPNSIRNIVANMQEGIFVELITATEARDSLAEWYLQVLDHRKAGAFLIEFLEPGA